MQELTPEEKKALVVVQKQIVKGIFMATKKPLKYKIIDYNSFSEVDKKKIWNSMLNASGGIYSSLLPKLSMLVNLPDAALFFDTYFEGVFSKEYEERQVKYEYGAVLVKGPLGEIYQVKNVEDKYKKENGYYVPVGKPMQFIRITENLFKIMRLSDEFSVIDDNTLQIVTSYGGTHHVQVGDVVLVDGDNFYRIKNKAFEATYDVI